MIKYLVKIIEGKKTYIGLAVTLFGVLGLTAWITPTETEALWKAVFEIVGIGLAVYGRAVTKAK